MTLGLPFSTATARWPHIRHVPYTGVVLGCVAAGALFLAGEQALAAEARMPVRAKVIGYEDVKTICADAAPPDWCPAHLRRAPAGIAASASRKTISGGTAHENTYRRRDRATGQIMLVKE
jgi:hypothetical protein